MGLRTLFLLPPNSMFMHAPVSSAIGHFSGNAAGTKASKCLLISSMLQPSLCPRSLNKVGAGHNSGRNGRLRGRGGNGSKCIIWERPGKLHRKTPHSFFPMPLAKASCHAEISTIHNKPKQKAATPCMSKNAEHTAAYFKSFATILSTILMGIAVPNFTVLETFLRQAKPLDG